MEINLVIKAPDLVTAAKTLADALNNMRSYEERTALAAGPQEKPASKQKQQPGSVPASAAAQYDLAQLSVAATPLVDCGKMDEIRRILNAMGVQALIQLPKDRYGDFAMEIRRLGARI